MRANVTIKDVAEESGVSVATVSRVLSGKSASEKAKLQVYTAIKKLHYTPNGLARSLRSKQNRVVAVLVSDVRNPYFGLLAHGLQTSLAESGYAMIIGNASENFEQQEQFLHQALEHRVDGMILVIQSRHSSALKQVQRAGVPVVFVDRTMDGYEVPTVDSDAYPGIREALIHLQGLGHKRIGMVLGPEHTSTTQQRLRAFQEVGAELGLETVVDPKPTGEEHSVALMQELLEANVSAAIIAYTPRLWPILSYLGKQGIHVPQDLSIIGYDDLPIMEHLNPPLTTINQDIEQMSSLAVEELQKLISGEEAQSLHLPTSLILRKSTARAK